jgi:hypothetical protein
VPEAFKAAPDIIKAASENALGLLALIILAIGILVYFLFSKENYIVKGVVFFVMMGAAIAFGVGAMEQTKRQSGYNIELKLLFPENNLANPFQAEVRAYVNGKLLFSDKTAGSSQPPQQDASNNIDLIRGVGGLVVNFQKRLPGDRLYVVVKDGDNGWRSDDMKLPEAHLQMNSVPVKDLERQ